jgi:hypothetical protein
MREIINTWDAVVITNITIYILVVWMVVMWFSIFRRHARHKRRLDRIEDKLKGKAYAFVGTEKSSVVTTTRPKVAKRIFIFGANWARVKQHVLDNYPDIRQVYDPPQGGWIYHDADGDLITITPITRDVDILSLHASEYPVEHQCVVLAGWQLDKSGSYLSRCRRLMRDVEFAERRRMERSKSTHTQFDWRP